MPAKVVQGQSVVDFQQICVGEFFLLPVVDLLQPCIKFSTSEDGHNAINLDGDGSTTLAIQDPRTRSARLVNHVSSSINGRAVGSSLAVFAPPPGAAGTLQASLRPDRQIALSWPAESPDWALERWRDDGSGSGA